MKFSADCQQVFQICSAKTHPHYTTQPIFANNLHQPNPVTLWFHVRRPRHFLATFQGFQQIVSECRGLR